MNPHKLNKIDVSAMSEQEQKAFKLYGKLPQKTILTKMQKDRKYFDSGDYMMSKAGVPAAQAPGTAIPTPEGVPHASPPTNGPPGLSSSPTTGSHNGNLALPSVFAEGKPRSPERIQSSNQLGVGVGISPAATSEAMDMPGRHARRPSESHPRVSPPATMREGNHTSSFPIQHAGSFGSSPVKTSNLAKRLDEEMAD